MKRLLFISVFVAVFFSFSSCLESDEYSSDPHENFEALWKVIDENYCFFDYKDIDWDGVHKKYASLVADTMSRYELFDLLGKMLGELKDGQTNLISAFNVSRFWDWSENYPDNFNAVVHKKYIGTSYYIAGGMKYLIL
ncbi:MAG: peptidase S41, partial [Tannerella sp.]|nr:peptidase S41 [Tannerella sp.]